MHDDFNCPKCGERDGDQGCQNCGYKPEPLPERFAFTDLVPPELTWQTGKTAGEITLLQFVLRARHFLHYGPLGSNISPYTLYKETTDLLEMYGIPDPEINR